MSRPRGLQWTATRDLVLLSDEIEKSVNLSMNSFDNECSLTCIKVRPTYITDEVLKAAKELLQNQDNNYPMIIVDIEANKVVIGFVTVTGPNVENVTTITRWELVEIGKYQYSSEIFFGFIAFECFEMVRHFSSCFGAEGPKTVLCSMVVHFESSQSSIKDSKLTKFSKDFDVAGCDGQDLVQLLNIQLMALGCLNPFKVVCTHMMNGSMQTMAGICMQLSEEQQPDILLSLSIGFNIVFIEKVQIADGFQEQNMIISSEIYKFGEAIGSTEYNFLKRFISRQDLEINDLHVRPIELSLLFLGGHQMCQTVLRFFRKKIPDFSSKYNWLNLTNALRTQDISNFLESIHLKSNFDYSFKAVYNDMNEETRKEFVKLCQDIRDRSASMIAGILFGIVKRVAQKSNKNKLVVGLTGEVMVNMFKYREKFESAIRKVQAWHTRKNGNESSIDVTFIDSSYPTLEYGVISLGKYIWTTYYTT